MSTPNRLRRALSWLSAELGLQTMRTAGKDVYIIIAARFLRLFAYGAVALILALYFEKQNFSDDRIGLFMTLTLLGDVLVSLLLTLVADRLGRRRTLLLGALAMAASGTIFATSASYPALLVAAIVGVISPSGNEIGPFRAVEESTLAHLVDSDKRADVYGFYVILAVLGTSTGLVVGGQTVDYLQGLPGWEELDAYRAVFWIYTGVGCIKAVSTLFLSERCEHVDEKTKKTPETEPLLATVNAPDAAAVVPKEQARPRWWGPISTISRESQVVMAKLCSLFFFDSFGSGLVPFSLINFYLERKFTLPKGKLGGIMSATWFMSTAGNLFASSLAKRLGLIQAMVCTHLPSSIFLGFLPAAPDLPTTVLLLIGRSVLSSMDQAPRSAFIAQIVLPQERTAVMGVVNILKTLSQSAGPLVTGLLAGRNHFWVAFVVAGSMKAAYDVMLLGFFGGKVHNEMRRGADEVTHAAEARDEVPTSTARA